MTRLHAEIARSISFYRSQQGGAAPEHIYLSGGSTEVFTDRILADKDKPIHLVIASESRGLDGVTNLERIAVGAPAWTHRFLRWFALEDGYDPLVLYRLNSGVIGH